MSPYSSKKCTGICQRRLPVDEEHFYRKSDSSDGFRHECKDCYKAKRRKSRPALA